MARFNKANVLTVLEERAESIAKRQSFDRNNGTSQLARLPDAATRALIDRAVEYGKMRAYEQFAGAIEDGFNFDLPN